MTPRARIAIVAVAVVALVIAFVVASGSGDKKTADSANTVPAPSATSGAGSAGATTGQAAPAPKPALPVVRVVGGKPQGGVKKLTFKKGETIRFTVRSDQGGEIHFHGYDVHEEIPNGGGKATFTVPAKIEGRFVVEMEATGTQIAEVEVDPS